MSELFALHWPWALAIIGMSVATYATRVSGLLLLGGVEVRGRMKAALDAVPVSVMMAVITPTVLMTGKPETITAAIVAACAYFKLPLLVNIIVGMVCVVTLRNVLGG